MTMRMLRRFSAACVLALLSGAAALAEESAPDPVVAVVDGKELRRSDVVESASGLPAPYQQQIDQIFPALIERLIDLNLLAQEARRQDLQSAPEVRAKVAEYEEQIVREALLDRYLQQALTDDAIEARYRRMLEDYPEQTEIRARHILLETEEEARQVIEEIKGGADFVALATERSADQAAAAQGGDLGYFVAEQMVPEFAEAAFALEAGEMSEQPIKSRFGWHVVKVEDRRPKAPPTLEEARDQIEAELSQELVGALLADLRAKASIQRFNPDGTPIAEPTDGTDAGEAGAAPAE